MVAARSRVSRPSTTRPVQATPPRPSCFPGQVEVKHSLSPYVGGERASPGADRRGVPILVLAPIYDRHLPVDVPRDVQLRRPPSGHRDGADGVVRRRRRACAVTVPALDSARFLCCGAAQHCDGEPVCPCDVDWELGRERITGRHEQKGTPKGMGHMGQVLDLGMCPLIVAAAATGLSAVHSIKKLTTADACVVTVLTGPPDDAYCYASIYAI
ncbi:hypothetical protein B0H21DRAFT_826471 [Amylocystis lapponica]|nr:hypothetical protein B0H21DRAFT_826471 [Amylocystis lapponica]